MGYLVSRVYDRYSDDDCRKWTVVINPNTQSLMVTCIDNGEWPHKGMYGLDDNGKTVPTNFYINTDSIEVVSKYLCEFKVPILETAYDNRINNKDERKQKTT